MSSPTAPIGTSRLFLTSNNQRVCIDAGSKAGSSAPDGLGGSGDEVVLSWAIDVINLHTWVSPFRNVRLSHHLADEEKVSDGSGRQSRVEDPSHCRSQSCPVGLSARDVFLGISHALFFRRNAQSATVQKLCEYIHHADVQGV